MENLQRSNLHVFKDIIWLDLNRWNADMELGTQHIPAANRSFATNQPSLMVDSKVVIALGKCVFVWNEYWQTIIKAVAILIQIWHMWTKLTIVFFGLFFWLKIYYEKQMYNTVHSVWKWLKMSHFEFLNFGIFHHILAN